MSVTLLGGKIEPRAYQLNLFELSKKENTLIVLPTGLGKTIIAAMLADHIIRSGSGKVMFLAPTKPLVTQHYETLTKLLDLPKKEIVRFTGEVESEDRTLQWVEGKVIISTPQVAWNDIRNGTADLSRFSLIIFDEAHRATGNYAYVQIAKAFLEARGKLILGITASPGGNKEKLQEIKENLGISQILVRSETDPDVAPYIGGIKTELIRIKMPQKIAFLSGKLKYIQASLIDKIKATGLFKSDRLRRSDLAKMIPVIVARAKNGEKYLFTIIPLISASIRLDYLIEYLESQGVDVAKNYLREINESDEATIKRTKKILEKFPEFHEFVQELENSSDEEVVNPKMQVVLRICEDQVKGHPESRIIVFTHFRKTSDLLTAFLRKNSPFLRPIRFVGQSTKVDDVGLSQREQEEILTKFRNNIYNVLVATSVAEEGLDIPSTDLVIFFEPVPSEIRSIQRRGRTGRLHAGEVKILMYEGSRDIGYYYSSIRKEGKMRRNISNFNSAKTPEPAPIRSRRGGTNLDDF
ncbi:DEAD/DEAH box helicase family protein [Thermoplasmatales archaeon AK]|nr:DEAD/DEAH box helicase family protein [Thermoplasmatales archaeon AK]